MKNRIPYPGQEGRIKLIFEDDGSERHAIAEMADNPIEEGTELNKANLLSDDTSLLIGIDPLEDPTPDNALQMLHNEMNAAAGAARAMMLDGNINDEANRSALGEFTQYKDTYGVGYALFMHALRTSNMSASFVAVARNYLRLCKDRRQVAQSANAVQVISSLPAAKGMWRRYAYGIKGKTEVSETDYSQYIHITRNPVNGYLYGWINTSSYNYQPYVSRNDGKTWENIKTGASVETGGRSRAIAFSSDYKYTYFISNADTYARVYYSTDGINFSSSYFQVEGWKNSKAHIYDNIFTFKAAEGRYYYITTGDNEMTLRRTWVFACDGMSKGSSVTTIWHAGYQDFMAALPVSNGVVVVTSENARSDYAGGTNYIEATKIVYSGGNDAITTYTVKKDELDDDYTNGSPKCNVQVAENGDIYLSLYTDTKNNGSAQGYYKVTQSGNAGGLGSAQSFPAGKDGNYGLVYKLPSGQVYAPYISSYTGQLVKDNWGVVIDGIKVMPTFGADQRGHIASGDTLTIYSYDEHKKYTESFIDKEAE